MNKTISILLISTLLQTIIGLSFDNHFMDKDECEPSIITQETNCENSNDDSNSKLSKHCCEKHSHPQHLEGEVAIKKSREIAKRSLKDFVEFFSLIPSSFFEQYKVMNFKFKPYSKLLITSQKNKIHLLNETFRC